MLFNITFHVGFKFEDGEIKYATVSFRDWSKTFDERYYSNNLQILKESVETQFGKKVKEVFSISDDKMTEIKGQESSIISFYSAHEEYAKTLKEIAKDLQEKIQKEREQIIKSVDYQEKTFHTDEADKYIAIQNGTFQFLQIVVGNIGRFDERELPLINTLIEMYKNNPEKEHILKVLYSMKAEI